MSKDTDKCKEIHTLTTGINLLHVNINQTLRYKERHCNGHEYKTIHAFKTTGETMIPKDIHKSRLKDNDRDGTREKLRETNR